MAETIPISRLVVETRLDSLEVGVFDEDVVCGSAGGDSGLSLLSPSSPSHMFSPPTQLATEEEESSLDSLELYDSPPARVTSLRLNTNLPADLNNLLETPSTEAMLDNILAETDCDYIDNKWTQHLDDLFPELD